jgi:hypothetical protein
VTAETSSRCDLIRSAPWTLILAIAIATADSFGSHDLWWHIPEGRIILATGHLPITDSCSFTAFGQPWRNHEWLAQVLLATAWDKFGALGLKLLKLGCAATLMTSIALVASADPCDGSAMAHIVHGRRGLRDADAAVHRIRR